MWSLTRNCPLVFCRTVWKRLLTIFEACRTVVFCWISDARMCRDDTPMRPILHKRRPSGSNLKPHSSLKPVSKVRETDSPSCGTPRGGSEKLERKQSRVTFNPSVSFAMLPTPSSCSYSGSSKKRPRHERIKVETWLLFSHSFYLPMQKEKCAFFMAKTCKWECNMIMSQKCESNETIAAEALQVLSRRQCQSLLREISEPCDEVSCDLVVSTHVW